MWLSANSSSRQDGLPGFQNELALLIHVWIAYSAGYWDDEDKGRDIQHSHMTCLIQQGVWRPRMYWILTYSNDVEWVYMMQRIVREGSSIHNDNISIARWLFVLNV
jgi:hypothetical protein